MALSCASGIHPAFFIYAMLVAMVRLPLYASTAAAGGVRYVPEVN
jgi:hypothetical protein